MGSYRVWDNSTLPLETTIQVSSDLIKKTVEEPTIGQEKNQTFMRVNSKEEKDTEEEPFGGPMEAGIRVNSEKVFKAVTEPYSARVE